MKLIVGLGNSGEKYINTRHNVGFLVIDELKKCKIWPKELNYFFKAYRTEELAKPPVFMNISGGIIAPILRKFRVSPQNLLVIHDDLDIALGLYKLQFAKGPKVHNGIISIEQFIGTNDFYRLRVGVENGENRDKKLLNGKDYVLQKFTTEELNVLKDLVDTKIVVEIKNWLLKK